MSRLPRTPEHELKVMESAGGPRSGKGTITKHLGSSYAGAQTDETGLDYRAVTLGLLEAGTLEEGMDGQTVATIINALDGEEITDLAANRYELIASFGEKALHEARVSGLVGKVSPHDHVRLSIKTGFRKRVQRQYDIGTKLLIIDGRCLDKVLKGMVGINIVLRMFVDCEVPVAVKREAARNGIDLGDPANEEWYLSQFESIMGRRSEDEIRENDPAIPDNDAIKYWYNTHVRVETAKKYAEQNKLTLSQAMNTLTEPEFMRIGGRVGAGTLAYATGRQVYYDTTEILEAPMKEYAKRMADEALDAHAKR